MLVRQTSLEAYESIKESLGNRQKEIYELIRDIQPCTNYQLSKMLSLPINCITGRVNELRKKGLIIDNGTVTNFETGKQNLCWVIL